MTFARIAFALPAVFLLGTAQLAAQERGQERMQETPMAQQDACQVTFYMVEETQADHLRDDETRQDRPGDYRPGQQEAGIGQQQQLGEELPLRGEQVTTLPVQTEPVTLWAQFHSPIEQPRSVRVEGAQTGVRLQQALAVQQLQTDGVGVAQDEWSERDERAGEQDRIEPAGREPGMPGEAQRVEAVLLQLETVGATQGQIEVIFQGATRQCTASLQVGDEMRDDFRPDEVDRDPMDDDPFDPEPREDDPFDPDPEA